MSDNLIIKKGIKIYTLPKSWGISDSGDYTFNAKFTDNAYSHGSTVIGDKMTEGRTIEISFDVQGTTEEEHDEVVNEAYYYFNQNDYKLIAGREDRYYNVSCLKKISHKWVKGYKQRYSQIDITVMLADPFRYATTETTITQTLESGGVVNITNSGTVESPLTIAIAPIETAAEIEIIHNQENTMTLTDSTLTNPSVCTINGTNGTVYRDSTNNINTFDGNFLEIEPGDNEYQYLGAKAILTFTFTPRWFI